MKKRAPKAPKKAVAKRPASKTAKESTTAVIPLGFPSGVFQWMKGGIMAILSQDAPAVKEVISSVASSGNYPSTADFEVLEHASKRLRSDPSVVRAAVASDGAALEFASTAIKNNKDIVKVAVTTSGGYAFMHASKELQRDPEIRKIHENHEYYFPE